MTEHRPRSEYTAQIKAQAFARYIAAIRKCEANGKTTSADYAEACGTRKDSAIRWLRENKEIMPSDLAALAWVQALIAPYVPQKKAKGPKAKPPKKRWRKPVPSAAAKVKRGWQAQVAAAASKPPAEKITLSEMPFKIEGISEKYQWRAPQMGASHERAQN
jgi:hypothetical protein